MPTFSLHHRHNIERTQQQRTLSEIDPHAIVVEVAGVTSGGDERRLRGLPAIGRGVAGAIAGSRPGANL